MIKNRIEAIEMMIEKFRKKGMPKHCGVCGKLDMCSKSDPEKVCAWLKASKHILARFKFILIVFIFVASVPVAFAAAPTLGTVSPSSGVGQTDTVQIFTTTYSDADGWKDLWNLNLLINTTSTDRSNCMFAGYNRFTNQLFLFNDSWTTALGGYAPGTNYVIENSYARLDCSKTIVSGSGNTITIKWAISFKPSFTGAKKVYLRAIDYGNGSTDFIQKGNWQINVMPDVVSVDPSFGSSAVGAKQMFSAVYSDPDGWQNLLYAYVIINTSPDGTKCLSAYYDQNTNKLYIRNDAKTAWLGGYAPGTNSIIENSYVSLDCSKTSINGSGKFLTVNWAVTFKTTFIGLKNIYLQITDDTGASSWNQKGTWTIKSDTVAPIVSINEPTWGAVITDV